METKPSSLLKSPWKFLRDVLQTGYSKFSVFPINLIIKPPILEDRISKLPDDVLQHILSFLPTKHAVATSILSTRWIRLWESVQVLDFDDFVYLFPERRGVSGHRELFFDFVDKVLSVNKSPIIFKFRLRTSCALSDDHLSRINGWIQNVVLRNVVEIDLILSHVDDGYLYQYEECLRIPGCSSLEILKIDCDLTLYMPTSGCCFPNLRVLDVHVRMQKTENDLARELIPSLPRLEELSLRGDLEYYDGEIYINVTGTALKVLDIKLRVPEDRDAEVMIDAPNLQVLRLMEFFLSSYQVKNMPRLNEIMIDIGLYYNDYIDSIKDMSDTHVDRLSKLLQGIDNAKSASISATTLLSHVTALHTTLPVFHYLTKLEFTVDSCIWVLMIHWLQSTPNLKHLLLDIREPQEGVYLEKEVDWSLSETVPPCLSSSITEIEITKDETTKAGKLLMYLLDNAKVLDKFIVNSHAYIKDGVPQALFTGLKKKIEKETVLDNIFLISCSS